MTSQEVMKSLDLLIPGSKYFTWAEALYMKQMQAYAIPTEAQIATIITAAKYLDKIREHYNRPIVVHSWLRTPAYNLYIKGARNSQHMTGGAIDFHVSNIDVAVVQQELKSRKDLWPFTGELGVGWVHLDLREMEWFYP